MYYPVDSMMKASKSRLEFLRKHKLAPDEIKVVENIEKYGSHVVQISPSSFVPGWSFTIGLYELLGMPEVIVIGLKADLAKFVLNEIARRMRAGQFQPEARASDLLGNVECEFRSIEQKWLRQTMGYAVWFYGGDNFPAIQCIYPDINNKLPWEQGFDNSWRDRQPLLFDGAPDSRAEHDFWSANDAESSIANWKFPDAPHRGVFTTKRIVAGEDPILYVYHDTDDGAWQFHGEGESTPETLAHVCFHHVVDKDASLCELADLPLGWCASRERVGAPWIRALSENDSSSAQTKDSSE
jgi:hypothetical protein